MVWNTHTGTLEALTIEERERALGYATGATAACNVTDQQRHAITGSCMDANAMQYIMAVSQAIRVSREDCQLAELEEYTPAVALTTHSTFPVESWAQDHLDVCPAEELFTNALTSAIAEVQEGSLQPPSHDRDGHAADIWNDNLAMEYLTLSKFSDSTVTGTTQPQRLRAQRRASFFKIRDGKLYRAIGDSFREVPKPEDRAALVRTIHERGGHFGTKRTAHLVMLSYWWVGMHAAVKECVLNCQACSQVKSSFNSTSPTLQSLPVSGLFYRWHVDLCGPFAISAQGNQYVMVAVDAFSKHAELVPIKNKTAATVSYAYLHNVLAKFGASAEVVSDGGGEFQSEFHQLMVDALIDHRNTSSNHPQANGLAERCVQTLKQCLKSYITPRKKHDRWDEMVAWIALAYRVTPQASTKFAPYQLLYAVGPTLPPCIRDRMLEPIDFDGSVKSAEQLMIRCNQNRSRISEAGQNLLITKHKDTLRYAYLPAEWRVLAQSQAL